MAHRAKLGQISPTKALSIYNTLFSDDQQENKTKYAQSLQLSVTEHFNKTILCIVLLILFTPYQEMIYPLSSHIQLHNQGFFFVYSGSGSDTISCGTP